MPPFAAHGGSLSETELLGGAEAILRFAVADAKAKGRTSRVGYLSARQSDAMTIGRRDLMLGGIGAGLAAAAGPRAAAASEEPEMPPPFSTYGIVPGGGIDQTASLQEAADKAGAIGYALLSAARRLYDREARAEIRH